MSVILQLYMASHDPQDRSESMLRSNHYRSRRNKNPRSMNVSPTPDLLDVIYQSVMIAVRLEQCT